MCAKCYHDDAKLTSASLLNICLYHAVADYQAFTMHVTVSNCHFLMSSTLLDKFKLLINSYSHLVELLFFSDIKDTISSKY